MVCEALCKLNKFRACDTARFCLIRDCVFKLCCHDFITGSEFELVELGKFTVVRRLSRPCSKFVLRCANKHTKRVIRTVLSGALLGGTSLWDLGSGSAGLSLCWCARFGANSICFERNMFSARLCTYNKRLTAQAVRLVKLDYRVGLFGARLPDRVFFGCGLKRFRD